jgi:hypothetical protein
MKQQKIRDIGFKKKNALRSAKNLRNEVDR